LQDVMTGTSSPEYRTGVGALSTIDFRVAHRVSLETRLAWYPTSEWNRFQTQGGRTLEVGTGFRLEALRLRRLVTAVSVLAGVVRLSNTDTSFIGEPINTPNGTVVEAAHRTTSAVHPTLQFGGNLVLDVTRKLFIRADLSL